MISDNQMDQFFRDRLRDYPSSVPGDMWDRILEKKKRDRMFWLFFFRLFAIAVLVLGLTGGYLIFNQKKSSVNNTTNNVTKNQTPIVANVPKADSSHSSPVPDQKLSSGINSDLKNTGHKNKTPINYFDAADHTKPKRSGEDISSEKENTTRGITEHTTKAITASAGAVASNETKIKDENDSLNKKSLAKTAAVDSSQKKDTKKPEKQNQLNGKWYLDLYASPDYPIIFPHESEQSKLSYTIGIRLNRSLGKHFSVKTGIQYSRLNMGEADSGRANLNLNRLDIPVLAGYSIGNQNLKTTINGGAIFSWPLDGGSDFFTTNTGVSLYLGINFEEKINEKISLFAEPYYRYQLTNMTASTISFIKFVDVVGINIGVRYYFKKKQSGK
jgi:hypothetical protein